MGISISRYRFRVQNGIRGSREELSYFAVKPLLLSSDNTGLETAKPAPPTCTQTPKMQKGRNSGPLSFTSPASQNASLYPINNSIVARQGRSTLSEIRPVRWLPM